jgi:hypothetical protein
MKRVTLTVFLALFAASSAFAQAQSPGAYVVTAEPLNVRLQANSSGKVTDRLYKQQKVEVFEVNNGWARISQYYDGETEGLTGNIARWVFATHLSAELRITEEVDVSSPIYEAIKSSDDLAQYQHIFVSVSSDLVNSGECKLSDFMDIGGWWRSVPHQPRPVYYTYCGGVNNNHPIYVNTATRETFK